MAPPDRSDTPDAEGQETLGNLGLTTSRMGRNAARLASWVEWLLHPETHEYDRTVIYSDGTKREEPGTVTKANPTPGHFDPVELPFESVVAQYPLLEQYLDGMAAFSSQHVEWPNSALSQGAAALKSVWWAGNEHMMKLIHEFPDERDWSGPAARNARRFIGDMSVMVTQINKLVIEFTDIGPQYAVIVKTARDNFDQAAADLVTAFEGKFHNQEAPDPIDVMGIALTAITAGAVTYMSGGLAGPIVGSAITSAWSAMFTEATTRLGNRIAQGDVSGPLWSDLARTYMRTQADMVDDAIAAVESVNKKIEELLGYFDSDVLPLIEEYGR